MHDSKTVFKAKMPLPSSTSLWPGSTDMTVRCSGMPKNMLGTNEKIMCAGKRPIMKNAKAAGSMPKEEKIDIIVFECMPGMKAEINAITMPKRKNRSSISKT